MERDCLNEEVLIWKKKGWYKMKKGEMICRILTGAISAAGAVTCGAAAEGVSFADYIAVRNGCTITREAVSGTTLVDCGTDSYISRLKKMDANQRADLFVCQLSTNDATQKKPLGIVSGTCDRNAFDTSTVAGAIEFVISYAKETWNCPVMFYTNPKYDSAEYAAMVELLLYYFSGLYGSGCHLALWKKKQLKKTALAGSFFHNQFTKIS